MYKKEPLPQEKHTNEELYRRQVETLKLFLSKHAITQAQFDKSLSESDREDAHDGICQLTKSGFAEGCYYETD